MMMIGGAMTYKFETSGSPRMLIIGGYRMGFEITPSGERSSLRVFIEYKHPSSWIGRVLALVFAPMYAHWCVSRMANDAARRFAESGHPRTTPTPTETIGDEGDARERRQER